MDREQIEQEIRNLTCQLQSSVSDIGDWKIIKCCEAYLIGDDLPYNLEELAAQRQAVRDEINRLQKEYADK